MECPSEARQNAGKQHGQEVERKKGKTALVSALRKDRKDPLRIIPKNAGSRVFAYWLGSMGSAVAVVIQREDGKLGPCVCVGVPVQSQPQPVRATLTGWG